MADANEPSTSTESPESAASLPGQTPAASPETAVTATPPPPAATSGADPQTAFQAAPPAPTGSPTEPVSPDKEGAISLPPLKVKKRPPISAERLAAELRMLDMGIAGLVLVLGFLLAAFAIQNSDFWMHLATGRLLAHGEYTFGDNPFSYPATVSWINHSWLFDLGLYQLSLLGGGIEAPASQALVIVFKALAAAGLAFVLLSVRRRGQSLWAAALCTGLAMLALSPRLLLNSTCLSYLFLGLTIYLLTREPKTRAEETPGGAPAARGIFAFKSLWLLPLLFVLWVNVDEWYILGPLTVGLFLLGELLQKRDERPAGYVSTLALVFGVGLLACLVSPYGYHGITVPTELSYLLVSVTDWLAARLGIAIALPDQLTAAGRTLQIVMRQDPVSFAVNSPFNVFSQPISGLNVAGLAYFVLLLAGFISFALSSKGFSWPRFLVWVVFFLFSFFLGRTIPFFAVVAGAITALNIQQLVAMHFGTQVRIERGWRSWSLGGRLATVLAGLTLAVFTWPGLLHGGADDARRTHRVAWHVEPDLLLRRTAEQLKEVQGWGKLKGGFNFSPQLAHYCAWYCPEEKTFFDPRLALFTERAADFVKARQALEGLNLKTAKDWQSVVDRWKLDHLVLAYHPMRRTVMPYYLMLVGKGYRQPDVGGVSTIIGWLDTSGGEPFPGHTLDLDRLAFGKKTSNKAPEKGPGSEPEQTNFFNQFVKGPAPTPWDAQEAALYLTYAQSSMQKSYDHYGSYSPYLWPATPVSLGIGTGGIQALAGVGTSLTPSLLTLLPHSNELPLMLRVMTNRVVSKAAPLLAVRAARRAVAASPDDASSYMTLAKAYLALWTEQEEFWVDVARGDSRRLLWRNPELLMQQRQAQAPPPFPEDDQEIRQTVRQAQVVSAFHRALALKPDLEEAHLGLFSVYHQMYYLDASLHHLGEAIRCRRGKRPVQGSGQKAEQFEKLRQAFDDDLKQREAVFKKLEAKVRKRRQHYRLYASNKRFEDKVQYALYNYRPDQRKPPDRQGTGLAQEGLKVLLKAKGSDITPRWAALQLKLLLMLGRAREARERLEGLRETARDLAKKSATPALKRDQRMMLYRISLEHAIAWTAVLLAAADGDYAAADKELAQLERRMEHLRAALRDPAGRVAHRLLFLHTLSSQPLPALVCLLPALDRNQKDAVEVLKSLGSRTREIDLLRLHADMLLRHWLTVKVPSPPGRPPSSLLLESEIEQCTVKVGEGLRYVTNLYLLRGLLALERGKPALAAQQLRQASEWSTDLGPRYLDRIIADRYLEILDGQKTMAK